MSKKIINLTPHVINIITDSENIIIEPSGTIARCKASNQIIGSLNTNIPVTKTVFGAVENLPEQQECIIYIVSMLVAQSEKHRNDLYFPNDVVRDDKGNIIGCRSLSQTE